jgi:enoyl-CoA hydratase/carnithine racemase
MIITGASITAERSHEVGLVNHIVPVGATLGRARHLAQATAANAPMAVRPAKAVVTESVQWPSADAFALQRTYADCVRESADA